MDWLVACFLLFAFYSPRNLPPPGRRRGRGPKEAHHKVAAKARGIIVERVFREGPLFHRKFHSTTN